MINGLLHADDFVTMSKTIYDLKETFEIGRNSI